jgi:lipopolysaccharide biosynthesis glycosyltransferase
MLNFVYCFDKNYNFQALTSINSLLENCEEEISIYIIHNQPKTLNLDLIIHKEKANIHLLMIDTNKFEFPNLQNAHVSEATYFRLYISKLLPTDLDFIIYIDSDIICIKDPTKNIRETIRSLKKSSQYIAAKTELMRDESIIESLDRFNALEMKNNRYFNAGVLIIDFQYWVNNNIEETLFQILRNYYKNIKFWDQDILNKFFDGRYVELKNSCNYEFGIYNKDKYEQQFLDEDIELVHFNGKGKPWNVQNIMFDSTEVYQSAYRKLGIGYYHITFPRELRYLKIFLRYIFSLKFLNLPKPFNYLFESLKALIRATLRL